MAGFKGFSYDEYVKPLDSVQKAHNEVITDMASLSQNSEILDYYLDPNRDKESYNLYNKFKSELNFNVDDFAKNGLTRNNGMNLLNLHRNYNNNVANVLDAVKNREADRVEQQKLQAQSKGQTIFGLNGTDGDANGRSVDFYLQGNKGFAHQNLDEVRDEAMKFAAAASKRKYKNSLDDPNTRNMKAFANQYWRKMEETGYDDKQSYNIIKGLINQFENALNGDIDTGADEHPAGFLKNMKRMLEERNIEQFSDKDKTRMINAYINGIDEGLTYIPKDELRETAELKKAGRTVNNTYFGTRTAKTDSTRYNQNTIPILNLFRDSSSDSKRERLFNSLTNDSNILLKSFETEDGNVLHKIPTINDLLNGFRYCEDKKTYYVKLPGELPRWVSKEHILQTFAQLKNEIKSKFHCTDNEMKRMETESIESVLNEKMTQIKEWQEGSFDQVATELKINPEDASTVLASAWNRGGAGKITGAYEGLGYNPETNEYKFKSQVDADSLLRIFNQKNQIQKGMNIQIVFAPHKNDLYQVAFTSNGFSSDGKSIRTIYFPLSAFSSATGSQEANMLRDAYNKSIKIQNEIRKKLEENPDTGKKEELALMLRHHQLTTSYYEKQIFREAATRALNSDNDLVDPELIDLVTMEKVKPAKPKQIGQKTSTSNDRQQTQQENE